MENDHIGNQVDCSQIIMRCFKTVATLSDGQTTPDTDRHGHSLQSVIKKLSRKKKGSKVFKLAQTHRKNFVN